MRSKQTSISDDENAREEKLLWLSHEARESWFDRVFVTRKDERFFFLSLDEREVILLNNFSTDKTRKIGKFQPVPPALAYYATEVKLLGNPYEVKYIPLSFTNEIFSSGRYTGKTEMKLVVNELEQETLRSTLRTLKDTGFSIHSFFAWNCIFTQSRELAPVLGEGTKVIELPYQVGKTLIDYEKNSGIKLGVEKSPAIGIQCRHFPATSTIHGGHIDLEIEIGETKMELTREERRIIERTTKLTKEDKEVLPPHKTGLVSLKEHYLQSEVRKNLLLYLRFLNVETKIRTERYIKAEAEEEKAKGEGIET